MGTWTTDDKGMAIYPIDAYLPVVIHEFNHSFVNPLIDSNWPDLEQSANLIFAQVREPMQRQAYTSGKTMLYEALVRASVVVYLQQHAAQGMAAHRQLREEQHQRFVWTDTLVGLLNRYQIDRSQYPTLASFMPQHNAFYQRLASQIDTVLWAYDARCPKVVSLRPFANQDTNVDPKVEELIIRFDKSMDPEKHSILLAEPGEEAVPILEVERVADDKQAFKLKMKLEPNRTYSFILRWGGFRTPNGYLSDEYTVSFKTEP